MTILFLTAGLLLLIAGADMLVRGASRIARTLGVSPLVIGLTVVAIGTSAPEFAVGIDAAASGQGAIALGNVIGSNIFNVLLILGVAAVIRPSVVSSQLIRLDVPLMVGVSILVFALSLNGSLGRVEGGLLVIGLAGYIGFQLYQASRGPGRYPEPLEMLPLPETGSRRWKWNTGLVLLGLGALALGSHWLVAGAVTLAGHFGMSPVVIGLTIVAAGTSLPEVVTAAIASLKGEGDLAVGNVVGSNLFNLLGVLGLAALMSPGGLTVDPAIIYFDLPIMIVVAFACLPVFFTGRIVSRWEGVLLLAYYVAYTLYLLLATSQHGALPVFSSTMLYFAVPLTLLTLGVIAVYEWRNG